ncbi:MAG TPA: DUF488 family protein [Polyangiaceae bacterium]|nr:DUF488 family protein [Polyangiaceae bacterium]
MVSTKRAYDPASKADGHRVLVDRLWPRGVGKQALPLNEWMKEVAPSDELRKWFGHDPLRWTEFKRRYVAELKTSPAKESLRALVERASGSRVTLVYSARDAVHNNAAVLKSEIERRLRQRSPVIAAKGVRLDTTRK